MIDITIFVWFFLFKIDVNSKRIEWKHFYTTSIKNIFIVPHTTIIQLSVLSTLMHDEDKPEIGHGNSIKIITQKNTK